MMSARMEREVQFRPTVEKRAWCLHGSLACPLRHFMYPFGVCQ